MPDGAIGWPRGASINIVADAAICEFDKKLSGQLRPGLDFPDYAAWEIHPVMALRVVQAHARVLAIKFL